MNRSFLAALPLAGAALLFFACDADVEQSCVSGPCILDASAPTTDAPVCEPPPAEGDYPCEIFAILQAKCFPCHHEQPAIGPFPLLTFEDTQKPFGMTGRLRYQQMAIQISPAGSPRMPLQGIEGFDIPPLTDEELATLSKWLEGCAPPLAQGEGCECPGKDCTFMP